MNNNVNVYYVIRLISNTNIEISFNEIENISNNIFNLLKNKINEIRNNPICKYISIKQYYLYGFINSNYIENILDENNNCLLTQTNVFFEKLIF